MTPAERANLRLLAWAAKTGHLTTHLRKSALPESAVDRAAAYRARDLANQEKARNMLRSNLTKAKLGNTWCSPADNPLDEVKD